MSSPFPGMNPWLEGSEWTSFHTEFAVEIARQLSPRLSSRYVVRPEKRYVVTTIGPGEDVAVSSVYPDASVARAGENPKETSAAVLGSAAPLTVATLMPERVPQVSVEIRDLADRRLVTAIEVLSPTNKHGNGREEYLERRERLLLSSAHLIEIDLLRRGQRVPMQKPLPPSPYFVFVGRKENRPQTQVWPVELSQALPNIPIPLLAGDEDASLDLQMVLSQVYEDFGYGASINYDRPPEIPLPVRQATWARERIEAWKSNRPA
ncbi:MAG TPA: DUF4058 family protein [Tepidisphaeraceae bacterium]|nr:DUF4058 family protein [Tepidisphaeraceae bacterium]